MIIVLSSLHRSLETLFSSITELMITTHVAFSPLIILTRMKRLKASPRLKTAGEGSEGPNSGTDFSENTDMWYESVSWKDRLVLTIIA